MPEIDYSRLTVGDNKVCDSCVELGLLPPRPISWWEEQGLLPRVAPTECNGACRCSLVPASMSDIQAEAQRLIDRAVEEGFDRGLHIDLVEGRRVLLRDFTAYEDLITVQYDVIADMENLIKQWKIANNEAMLPKGFYKLTRITDMVDWLENSMRISKSAMEKFIKRLSASDSLKMIDYTKEGYRRINEFLRTGDSTGLLKNDLNYIKSVSEIIDKAPKYLGDVYRGMGFKSASDYNAFIKDFNVGGNVVMKGFTSSTTDVNIISDIPSFKISAEKVVMKIKSKTGVFLDELSHRPEELEVLFQKNTSFRVTAINRQADKGLTMIKLEEI